MQLGTERRDILERSMHTAGYREKGNPRVVYTAVYREKDYPMYVDM